MRLARLIGPELETLLTDSPGEVRELLDEIHPEDMADVIDDFDDDRATRLLTELPTDYAAQVFERLEEDRQGALAARIGLDSMARIATEMDADERADFFSRLPPAHGTPLLDQLEKVDPEAAEDVEELRRWPETSAGGLMTTGFISIPANLLISDVITEVRRRADEAETIDVVYVVSEGERLLGVMSMRDLLMADSHQVVNEVMRRNIISVPPELDQEEAARKLAKYDLNTLPVVDDQGVLLGVITADDILDVLTEEQAEDVQKMGAVAPIPEGYFDASFAKYVQRRAPWLMVLFVGSYFTASAMEQYDDVLSAVTQLAFYVPLLISTGGNSGSQSATLVIRGLAVGEIRPRDWWRVLLRELGQGLTLGLLLAVFGVLRVLLAGDGADFAALIAIVVVAIVTAGCVIGGMLPLLLHRLGVDPATSSSPFVATLSDVVGIVVYLGTARWLLLDVLAKSAPGH